MFPTQEQEILCSQNRRNIKKEINRLSKGKYNKGINTRIISVEKKEVIL